MGIWAWKSLYWVTKCVLTFFAKILFRVQFVGVENIPKEGGLIIASNHISHLDPPIVALGVPRHIFHIAKEELAMIPFLALVFRLFGTITIDRRKGQKALETAEEYLKRGLSIIIFPEGTRSATGRLQKGRTGIALLALRTGVRVVPSAIIGSDKCMPKHSKFIKPGKIIVKYGRPMDLGKSESRDITREKLVEATNRIMRGIEELLPENMRPAERET